MTVSVTATRLAAQVEPTLEAERGEREHGMGAEDVTTRHDLVGHDGRFTVGGQACASLIVGWAAEDVETEVVTHESGEQGTVGR